MHNSILQPQEKRRSFNIESRSPSTVRKRKPLKKSSKQMVLIEEVSALT
jgi:hypothetical protein